LGIFFQEKNIKISKNLAGNLNQVTLTLFWDGLARSNTGLCVWPLLFYFNEFPIEIRTKDSLIFIATIYFGDSKPISNIILAPVVHQLILIHKNPPKLKIENELILVNATCYCLLCDLPAKSDIMNFMGFNSYFGYILIIYYFF